jgi:diacylglycerol O-acyltransferase / wax synthase
VTERMSPVGSIMWGLGNDAALRMIVGNLMILDGAPQRAALAERLGAVAADEWRLRQHPDAPAGVLVRPAWVDEEKFDPNDHIRMMAVAAPGDLRQVLELVTLLELAPFDANMSPWDITVIEGLEGGRAAVYLRAHHCLTDGLHGVSLVRLFLDEFAPDHSRSPRTAAATGSEQAAGAATDSTPAKPSPRRRPGTVSINIDVAAAVAGAVEPIANGVAAALRVDPLDAIVSRIQRSIDVVNSVSRQVVVTGGPLSQLPHSRSMNSRFEALSVPGARRTALGLGGSRNDLLVAGAAIGLGRYHERLGTPCTELRLASPARWRNVSDGGGSVVPTRVEIPVANGRPGPLFGVVAERLSKARREPALRVTELLASAISHMPSRLLLSTVRAQANSIDFVATTVPGIRGVRHICGAVVEKSFPFGPRLGSLMNITGFGVDDRLDVGIGLDPSAITEPDLLVQCMMEAFQSMAAANGS